MTHVPAPFVAFPEMPLWRGDRGVTLSRWDEWALAYGERYADRKASLAARSGILPAAIRHARAANVVAARDAAMAYAASVASSQGWALPAE